MELKSEFDKAVTLSCILCGHSKTLERRGGKSSAAALWNLCK